MEKKRKRGKSKHGKCIVCHKRSGHITCRMCPYCHSQRHGPLAPCRMVDRVPAREITRHGVVLSTMALDIHHAEAERARRVEVYARMYAETGRIDYGCGLHMESPPDGRGLGPINGTQEEEE